METLLKVGEVAKRLRVSVATIRRMAQRGELPGLKIGKQIRYREADVDALMASQGSTRLRRHWLMHEKVRDGYTIPMKMLVTIPTSAFRAHTSYETDHKHFSASIRLDREKGLTKYIVQWAGVKPVKAPNIITARYVLVDAWWQWIHDNPKKATAKEIEDAYNLCLALHRRLLHFECEAVRSKRKRRQGK